jgi:hypothetical protein
MELNKDKCEYPNPLKLKSYKSKYFVIPSPVILLNTLNHKRVSIFSYLSIKKGLDNNLILKMSYILDWLNKKEDRHKNGINEKIIECIEYFCDMGYLKLFDTFNSTNLLECCFNSEKLTEDCQNGLFRFAIIYLDEVNTILNYRSNDTTINSDIVLLVFAYLRMKIYRRPNKLDITDINLDNKNSHSYDIKKRRERAIEAYDCYYYEIAEDLGITERVVSKAINILYGLNLIYFEGLPKTKYDDKWKTNHTIFCNTYKRENGYLLAEGKEYYLPEIDNKKKKLHIK